MKSMVQYDNCPICSGRIEVWRQKTTDHGCFTIDRCGSCGYAFVNPRPSIDTLMEFYREYGQGPDAAPDLEALLQQEAVYPNSTRDAEQMVSTIHHILGRPGSLLDVGCGYGFFVDEAKRQGFDVTAIEIAPGETAIPRRLTGLHPIRISFEHYRSDEQFDAILFSQVLEHAHDVNAWVGKATALLRPGGVLAVALPNFDSIFRRILGKNDPYVTPPVHLNFFTGRSLRLLLRTHGLAAASCHTFSRFPKHAVAKRLGRWRRLTAPMYALAVLGSRCLDGTGLAMMLHVYAVK